MHIDVRGELDLDIERFVANRCAVLGASGGGKSNTVAVLIEEMAAHIPFCIVDPHGEYWGLREKLDVLIVGNSENVDLKIGVDQAEAIAEYSYQKGFSVILDLLLFEEDERIDFVIAFFTRLWQLGIRHKKPYGIVIDEAHNFMPEGSRPPVKKLMLKYATEGRKFGFGLIVSTQTTTEISKTVLKQMGLLFLHRVFFPSDIKVYQQIVPLESADTKAKVSNLKVGEALVVYNYRAQVVQIRRRDTFHAGLTPFINNEPPKLQAVDETMLADIQQVLANGVKPIDELSIAQRQIVTLEQALTERDRQLAELKQRHEDEVNQLQQQLQMLERTKLAAEQMSLPLTNGVMQVQPREIVAAVQEPAMGGDDYRSPLATTKAIKAQERGFSGMVADIKRLSPMHNMILKYLMQREDLSFTVKELARYMGYSTSTLTTRPPLPLIDMGLIMRCGERGEYRYSAAARGTLRERFPDLDTEKLIERLLAG